MASGSDVRAGGAFVEFYSRGEKAVQQTLANLQARMKNLGRTVAIMGATLGASGASVTAPFLHGLNVASETSSQIISASRRTGIGFTELQTLSYALKVDFDELAGATRKMNSFLDEAARGSADANLRLDELGLSVEDLQRLSQGDRLRRIADSISRISDVSQRGAAQTHIFGRAAMGMDLTGGAAGISGRQERGSRFALSEADVQLIGQYNLAQRDMGLAAKALWSTIGAAAAGPMTEFFQIVTELILAAKNWADENRPLLTTIFRIADATVAVGAALTGLGGAVVVGSYLFGIMGAGLSFLAVAAYYLTGAFLVAKVATWLWAAAVWGYNAATSVGHLLTWGWIAILVALGVAIIAVEMALGGAVIAVLAFAGYMLWTRGIITDVWNWIVGKFDWAASKIRFVLALVTQLTLAAWRKILGLFSGGGGGGFLSYVWDFWAERGAAAIAVITGLFSRLGGIISGSVGVTVANISTLFSGLSDTASSAWSGIKDAFSVGDWSLLWEILKTTVLLAWGQIAQFGNATWIEWKYTALEVFYAIKDLIVETFESVWTALKVGFFTVWAEAKATAFEALAAIARAAARSAVGPARDLLNETARGLDMDAQQARSAGNRSANAAESDAIGEWFDRQTAAVVRDMELAGDELQEFADNVEGWTPEVERLRGELAYLQAEAETAAIVRQMERDQQLAGAGDAVDNRETQHRNLGTFSATAAAGFAGSPVDRLERLAERNDAQNERIIAALINRTAAAMG